MCPYPPSPFSCLPFPLTFFSSCFSFPLPLPDGVGGGRWALVRHLPQGSGPGGDIGCRHSSIYAKTQDFFHIPLPAGCQARIYLVTPLLAWHLLK